MGTTRRAAGGGNMKSVRPASANTQKRNLLIASLALVAVGVVVLIVLAMPGNDVDKLESPECAETNIDPVTINVCQQLRDCVDEFDATSCTEQCPFGFETNTQGCVVSCKCSMGGTFEGDIRFNAQNIPTMMKQYGDADPSDYQLNVFSVGGLYSVGYLFEWYTPEAGYLQPDGRIQIPYRMDGSLTQQIQDIIRETVPWFSKNTCVDFVEREKSDKRHYINMESASSSRGCSTEIGCMLFRGTNDHSGSQWMNLAPYCNHSSVIIHELFHSLGIFHEQSRPDRDDHVKINYKNIKWDKTYNFKKMKTGVEVDATGLHRHLITLATHYTSPFDLKSIMMYSGRSFAKKNTAGLIPAPFTIEKRGDPTYYIKPTYQPSDIDIKELNDHTCSHYNKDNSAPSWTIWSKWSNCESSQSGGNAGTESYRERRRGCKDRTDSGNNVNLEKCANGALNRENYVQRDKCNCNPMFGGPSFRELEGKMQSCQWGGWQYLTQECVPSEAGNQNSCEGFRLKKRKHSCTTKDGKDYYREETIKKNKVCDSQVKLESCTPSSLDCKNGKVRSAWANWAAWSKCSLSCGAGTKERVRRCVNKLSGLLENTCDGYWKPIHKETAECNLGVCVLDPWMEWGQWSSPCNMKCERYRHRNKKLNTEIKEKDSASCLGGQCYTPTYGKWGSWDKACSTANCHQHTNRRRECLSRGRKTDQWRCDKYGKFYENKKCYDLVPECAGEWSKWKEDLPRCGSSCDPRKKGLYRRNCYRDGKIDWSCKVVHPKWGKIFQKTEEKWEKCSERDSCNALVTTTTANNGGTTLPVSTTLVPTPPAVKKFAAVKELYQLRDRDVDFVLIGNFHRGYGPGTYEWVYYYPDDPGRAYMVYPRGKDQLGPGAVKILKKNFPTNCIRHDVADIDGDDYDDYICTEHLGWDSKIKKIRSKIVLHNFQPKPSQTLYFYEDCERLIFLDINGDGRKDFMCYQKSGFYSTYITNKNGFMIDY